MSVWWWIVIALPLSPLLSLIERSHLQRLEPSRVSLDVRWKAFWRSRVTSCRTVCRQIMVLEKSSRQCAVLQKCTNHDSHRGHNFKTDLLRSEMISVAFYEVFAFGTAASHAPASTVPNWSNSCHAWDRSCCHMVRCWNMGLMSYCSWKVSRHTEMLWK